LCLEYQETLAEKVPVLFNQDACSSPAMDSGRVREGYRLVWYWVKRSELGAYGWGVPEGCGPETPTTPTGNEPTQQGGKSGERPCPEPESPHAPEEGCCFDPECPPHHCLPLAVIMAGTQEELDSQDDIDLSGRRSIGQARSHLTHVCRINWPHGGVVSAGWLKKQRQLTIWFDRDLEQVPPTGYSGPRGINAGTFIVEYGAGFEDLDFVPYDPPPVLAPDQRTAVYTLDDQPQGPGSGFRYLIGHTVYVTLKCDFVLDCEGNPVDGNHLGGRLPTGDGVRGGTFESWFTVVSDDDCERMTKAQCWGA
jgi:hypothetical protein